MTPEDKQRDYKLRSRYGITLAEYNDMLVRQQSTCAICKKPTSSFKKHLAVDHNHETGYCRGLLCTFCNTRLLKYLRDNKKVTQNLIMYLQDALYNDIGWD